uniref:COP9 signalosome complex subunit 9 n=1 Tax=Tetranychus urticae TaxID=32264 RepID=T1KGW3_TETUR
MRPISMVGSKPGGSNGSSVVVDEMFPEGGHFMDFDDPSGTVMMDLTSNDKYVHTDFFNEFEDIFDEDNLE